MCSRTSRMLCPCIPHEDRSDRMHLPKIGPADDEARRTARCLGGPTLHAMPWPARAATDAHAQTHRTHGNILIRIAREAIGVWDGQATRNHGAPPPAVSPPQRCRFLQENSQVRWRVGETSVCSNKLLANLARAGRVLKGTHSGRPAQRSHRDDAGRRHHLCDSSSHHCSFIGIGAFWCMLRVALRGGGCSGGAGCWVLVLFPGCCLACLVSGEAVVGGRMKAGI